MIIIWILVPCLLCGAFFVYIAAWLTTTKGNTISDVLKSNKFADAEAIRLEILGKVKITSNIPIVALFIVASTVAIALPAFISWQLMKDVTTITLTGSVVIAPDKKVYAVPKDMQIESSGSFGIPILYSDKYQIISFEGKDYHPVTLSVKLNKPRSQLSVKVTGSETVKIPLDLEEKSASFTSKINLIPTTSPVLTISNIPSKETHVDRKYENIGMPAGG